MRALWSLQRYIPNPVVNVARRLTSPNLRRRLRKRFGGTFRSIPDMIVRASDGRSFRIGPDNIYWRLYVGLDFEPEATSVLRRLIRPGDTVLDVGANFGWYTTLLQNLVGRTGHVHAFEPVPPIYERLIENLALNGLSDQVTAVRTAIGKERGEVKLHVFDDLPAAHSSISNLGRERFTAFTAPIIDLGSYLDERDIGTVEFLKCDVEGSELMVLEGARGILASPAAPIVLVELNDETSAAFGFRPVDIWSFLSGMGYDHFYDIHAIGSIRRVELQNQVENVNLLLCGKGERIAKRMAGQIPSRAVA